MAKTEKLPTGDENSLSAVGKFLDESTVKYVEFSTRLADLVHVEHWGHVDISYGDGFTNLSTVTPGFVIEMVCPHGAVFVDGVAPFLPTDNAANVAERVFARAKHRCRQQHQPQSFPAQYLLAQLNQQPDPNTPAVFYNLYQQSLSSDITVTPDLLVVTELHKVFGDALNVEVDCPAPGIHRNKPAKVALHRQIAHLNDAHQWTRERIADWLDTLDIDLTVKPGKTGH